MATLNKKASELVAAVALTDNDFWAGVQAGGDRRFSVPVLRSYLGVPKSVANGMAPASFAADVSTTADLKLARGATITLTSTAQRLAQAAGGRMDLNGGKIIFSYSDTSNSVNFVANKLVNGTLEIATGRNIQRLLRFNERGALLRDMTVRSADVIDNVNDSNDALIRPYGDDFQAENCVLENVDTVFLTTAKNGVYRDLTFRGCVRGIVGYGSVAGDTTAEAYISNFRWFGTSNLATTDPGNNAISGNWRRLHVDKAYIGPSDDLTTFPQGTGEHGIYVVGPGKATEGELRLVNIRARRTGQCGIKAKDSGIIHASNIHVSGTSWGNSPNLNEEAFRFQRASIVTGGQLIATKELVAGALTGFAGFRHMFFSGCDNVVMLDESYAEGCYSGGVVFGIDDSDPTIAHGNHQLRVRHKNVGGASIIIEDNAYVNGEIIVFVDADGCPGSPVRIGSNITWGPNGNLVVIGTYRRCGAPPPDSTANVDLSRLRIF